MLGKLLSALGKPFTTATAGGVAFRDVFIMIGSVIGILGVVGVLTPQQVQDLNKTVEDISGQWPAIVAALGLAMASGMSIYRTLFKSTSDKAAEVAKVVDEQVPAKSDVVIKTPAGVPDIVVEAKPANR